MRAYLAAIDARDGHRLCSLLVPGTLRPLRLRQGRSGCARSLDASLGRRGRHGEPPWRRSRLVAIGAIGSSDHLTRVTISVRHDLAGTTGELPVEQDVVYLRPAGRGWLVAKPSAVLYRAVGIGDVPLDALRPPG